MSVGNVVLILNYVQSADRLKRNKTLKEKYGAKRDFYSCNSSMNYLRYVDEGSKEQNSIVEQDYLGYSGASEKSHGVFDQNGLMDKKGKTDLRNALRDTKSTIWHGIVSFEEAFGKRYCSTFEDAHRLMKKEFPRFLKNAGFDPRKVCWFAGLHENTDNLHIHFSFFELEPSRYTAHKSGYQFSEGRISARHFERFKVACEQRLTDISSEIKAARKDIGDLTHNLLFSKESKLRYQNEIQSKLKILVSSLPAGGRLSYDSENMSKLKPMINDVIDKVFKVNKPLFDGYNLFCKKAKEKDAKTLEILKRSKVKESEWSKYLVADKYLDDIYRRIGNQIIIAARVIGTKEKAAKGRLAAKRIQKRTTSRILDYILRLDSQIEEAAIVAFEDYFKKLEENKNEMNGEIEHEY